MQHFGLWAGVDVLKMTRFTSCGLVIMLWLSIIYFTPSTLVWVSLDLSILCLRIRSIRPLVKWSFFAGFWNLCFALGSLGREEQ